MAEPTVPENYPVQVRPTYTAVPVSVPDDEKEEQELALVGWVKSNLFAIISIAASLLTFYASTQVKPLADELKQQKESILEVKTAQAQVLGIMDTKYATKEVVEIKYDNLKESVDDLNESIATLTNMLIKEKK